MYIYELRAAYDSDALVDSSIALREPCRTILATVINDDIFPIFPGLSPYALNALS